MLFVIVIIILFVIVYCLLVIGLSSPPFFRLLCKSDKNLNRKKQAILEGNFYYYETFLILRSRTLSLFKGQAK